MEAKVLGYLLLLVLILYPIADAGIRWLHSWIMFQMEISGMSGNSERCKSLNPASGLCDWGTDCLCWHKHMHEQDAANTNEQSNMLDCYPSNKPSMKEIVDDTTVYTLWVDRPNPGLVPEDTQPVEVETEDGESFPGFGKYGG